MKVLILGGTAEASALVRLLVTRPPFSPLLSLAGRTSTPAPQPAPCRIGGFGGVEGLTAFLRQEHIAALIDATHPFARQISTHAALAAERTGVPFAILTRPPWRRQPQDRWIDVDTAEEAADALGKTPRRVFLTLGRLQLAAFAAAPQHDYLVRSIDEPGPLPFPHGHVLLARPPFDEKAERALLLEQKIDILVSKNAGSAATYAKIAAARALHLPVVMLRPPPLQAGLVFHQASEVVTWLEEREKSLTSP